MSPENDLYEAMRGRIELAGYQVVSPVEAAERLFRQLELHHLRDLILEGGMVINRCVIREERGLRQSRADVGTVRAANPDSVVRMCGPADADLRIVARQLGHLLMQRAALNPPPQGGGEPTTTP